MVKLVDTRDLKSLGDLAVPVQVRLGPPQNSFSFPAYLQKKTILLSKTKKPLFVGFFSHFRF